MIIGGAVETSAQTLKCPGDIYVFNAENNAIQAQDLTGYD